MTLQKLVEVLRLNFTHPHRHFTKALAFLLVLPLANQLSAQSSWTWNGAGNTWTPNGNWTQNADGSLGASTRPQGYLNFAGSANLTANNDYAAYGPAFQIYFNSGASAFTLTGNPLKFYDYGAAGNPTIQNDSSSLQTVNLILGIGNTSGGTAFNINPNAGDLTFGAASGNVFAYFDDKGLPLTINGTSPHTVTFWGQINNGGANTKFVLASNTIVNFNAANGYTGETDINAGELRIGSAGSIAAGSAIFLGNGGALSTVAQLSLAGSSGQNFSHAFTVNPGNANTRIIAGLNTSGTVTYSGGITLNGPANLISQSGGTVAFTTGVISGGSSVNINGGVGSPGTISLSGVNTYSGGTTISGGGVIASVSSITSGANVQSGALGTGNLTINNGATLSGTAGTRTIIAAPTINLAGNITICTNSGSIEFDGTIDLGGASRTVTLGHASVSYASGSEVCRFNQPSGFGAPTFQNAGSGGSLLFTTTTGSAANPSIARTLIAPTFSSNLGLTLDDGVAYSSGAGNFFSAGANAPTLTLNAAVSRGGGVLQMGDGAGNSVAVMRSAEVYSLAGGGTVKSDNTTGFPTTGTLTINNGNGQTFSGNITETGGTGVILVTKSGSGTQTLSGNNNYSGPTSVSGGTLIAGSGNALGTGLNSTAYRRNTTSIDAGPNITTVSSGAVLDLNGQTVSGEGISISGTGISSAGALINSAGGAASLGGSAVNKVSLTSAGSWTTGSFSAPTVAVNDTGSGGSGLAVGTPVVGLGSVTFTAGSGYSSAPTLTVSGGGGSGAIVTASMTGTAPNQSISSITIQNPGSGYTSLPTITVGSGNATVTAASLGVVSLPVTSYGSGYTNAANPPTLTFTASGWTTTPTATATVPNLTIVADASIGGSGDISINQPVTGNFNLTKVGANKLTFSGANTYGSSKNTTLSTGTLVAKNAAAFGVSSLILNGGTLDLANDSSVNAYNTTVGGTTTIQSDKATASSAGITHTLGTLSIGAQQLNVTKGANVSDNGAGLTFGTTTLTTPGPAIFDVASGVNLTLGALGGAFNFTKQNSGTLTLNTTGTRGNSNGGTTLAAGTLRLGALNALNTSSTGPLALNGGTLALAVDAGGTFNGTTMTLGGNSTIQVDRASSGTAPAYSLNTMSMGAFQLSVTPGANLTTDSAYGLTIGATTLTGNGTVDVANNGAGVGTLTIDGKLTGAFDFKKQGAGTVILNTTLSAGNRPSGSDTLQAGTLVVGQPSALGEVGCTLNLNGGTLDLANGGINALNTTVGGDATVLSDSSSAVFQTHTLGTLNIDGHTLTVAPGPAVSSGSGTAALAFGATTLTGSPTFNITNINTALAKLTLGAITDNNSRTLTVKGNGSFAQSGAFAGNLGLSLDSSFSGNALLNQANNFNGTITINNGTLVANTSASAMGTAPLQLNGGSLDFNHSAALAFGNNATVGGNATITSEKSSAGGGVTYTLGTLGIGGQTLTVSGGNVSSGTAGVTFGATTLSGSPTFTIINPTNGGFSLLTLGAVSDSNNRILNLKSNGNFAQSGVFAGNLGITQDATYSGTNTLNQANTYSGGTIVNGGTLFIGASSTVNTGSLVNGPTGTGNVTLANGANVNAGSSFTWNVPQVNLTGNINLTGGNRLIAGFNTLDLGTGTRIINVNGKSLSVTGGNTVQSGGEATGQSQWEIFTAPNGNGITIQNGVLDLETTAFTGTSYGSFMIRKTPAAWSNAALTIGNNVLLQMGSSASLGGPVLTINSAGIFDMAHFANTVALLADGSNGGGSIFNSMVAANTTAATLTINGTSGSASFSGIISDGPGTGSLSLTKAGASTQTLGGINTYSGATTVSAGKLVGVTGGSCANSPFTVSSGATNGVKVATANGQWTCGGLTNSAGTTYAEFDFGNVAPSTTTAPLQINGNFTAASSVRIIVRNGSSWAPGVYPLYTWTGTGPGNLNNFAAPTLPSGAQGTLSLNSSTISLNIGLLAPNLNYTNGAGTGLRIFLSEITSNPGLQSAQGSPSYSITGVSATSTQGGTVANNASTIQYTAPNSSVTNDTFTYTISDGAVSATATVTINFQLQASSSNPQLNVAGGTVTGTLYGIPGMQYDIQRKTNLVDAAWQTLSSPPLSNAPPYTADAAGRIQFTDTNPPPAAGYYRTIQH